ncbi:MAG: hypothetical protein V9F00_17635 [Nocardioides sp.]
MIALVPALAGALVVAGIIGVLLGAAPGTRRREATALRRVRSVQHLDRTSRNCSCSAGWAPGSSPGW